MCGCVCECVGVCVGVCVLGHSVSPGVWRLRCKHESAWYIGRMLSKGL